MSGCAEAEVIGDRAKLENILTLDIQSLLSHMLTGNSKKPRVRHAFKNVWTESLVPFAFVRPELCRLTRLQLQVLDFVIDILIVTRANLSQMRFFAYKTIVFQLRGPHFAQRRHNKGDDLSMA